MREETAKRLFEYRKAYGYSQEELAEKIGVSRQAISKWERGESSPDTENLIALSRLYNVTIDEMINTENEPVKAEKAAEEKYEQSESADYEKDSRTEGDEADEPAQTHVSFRNGIHIHDGKDKVDIGFNGIHIESKNGESVHIGSGDVKVEGVDEEYVFSRGKESKLFHAILPMSVIIAYLIIGFTFEQGWALGWLLVFIIPIAESFIAAVKTKKPSAFAYPVLVTAVYLTVGMFEKIWHPTWIMFLTIPVYYIIADFIKPNKKTED